MEAAVRSAGRKVAKQVQDLLAHHSRLPIFRDHAVALLARTTLCKAGEIGNPTPQIGNKISLITTFFQGCGYTKQLICEGQYAKAAAVLKQDLETVTRIHEIDAGVAKAGGTPNIKCAFGRNKDLWSPK